jgi:hypothetical protein
MREWTLCGGPPASGNVLSWEAAVKTAVGNLSGLSVSQVDTATLCSPSSAELTILPFKRDFKQVQYTIKKNPFCCRSGLTMEKGRYVTDMDTDSHTELG